MMSLQLQDIFFTILHNLIILFNLFGWMIPFLRKWNLISLTLTLLSWFGLGLIYGIGYCPLTDLHWDVKSKIGEINIPNSYIKYSLDKYFQIDSDPLTVDILTGVMFFLAFAISIYVNCFRKKNNSDELL